MNTGRFVCSSLHKYICPCMVNPPDNATVNLLQKISKCICVAKSQSRIEYFISFCSISMFCIETLVFLICYVYFTLCFYL